MLESLFGNKNIEKVLIYLLLHKESYASELSKSFKTALDPIQKTLLKLEKGAVLISKKVGKTKTFCWNPRYPFIRELQSLIKRAYDVLPPEIQERTYDSFKRKRPRKTDKVLINLR